MLSAMNPQVPRWALSLLDFRAHAVNPLDDHPFGVFVAFCGHRLLICELHEKPSGGLCLQCRQVVTVRRIDGRSERGPSRQVICVVMPSSLARSTELPRPARVSPDVGQRWSETTCNPLRDRGAI